MRNATTALVLIATMGGSPRAQDIVPQLHVGTSSGAAAIPAKPNASPPAALASIPPHARGDGDRPPRGRVCFNQADTREKIAAHRLTDPIRVLRDSGRDGEALRAKLCRWKADEFVYEVFVLRRDGHLVRVYMNAENGLPLAPGADKDRPERK